MTRFVMVEAWVLEELLEIAESEYATSHTYNVHGGAIDLAHRALKYEWRCRTCNALLQDNEDDQCMECRGLPKNMGTQ